MRPTTFLLLLCCMLLTACIGKMMNNRIQDDGVQIPPELGRTPDTLLAVMHGTEAYDRTLADRLASSYTGPYKLVTNAELSERYSNTTTYRYVFNSDQQLSTGTSGAMSSQFYVWDRVAQKEYRAKFRSGMYGKLMEVYLLKLDQKRKANGGH